METGNITPKQNKTDLTNGVESFGQLIQKMEETRPAPDIDPELADVDKIGMYISVFLFGHLCKMLGIKNRYSKMYDEVTEALGYKKDIPPIDSDEPEEKDDDDDEYEVETGGYMNDLDLPRERVSPYIEIFGDENPQEFVELIYYAVDESLTDDHDQLIPNADEVVGNEALYRLVNGGRGVIDGVIYVRNVKTHINYQIVLDAGSYASTVLGIN